MGVWERRYFRILNAISHLLGAHADDARLPHERGLVALVAERPRRRGRDLADSPDTKVLMIDTADRALHG